MHPATEVHQSAGPFHQRREHIGREGVDGNDGGWPSGVGDRPFVEYAPAL